MKPAVRYFGVAPIIATSLTVPHTASLPMSPPGKNSGHTTCESVLMARRVQALSLHHTGIIARAQDGIIERGQEFLRDQIVRQFAAAAVPHHDPIALLNGRRDRRGLVGLRVHQSCSFISDAYCVMRKTHSCITLRIRYR